MTPADIFNAEAGAIFVAILIGFFIVVALGFALVIIAAVASIILFIVAIVSVCNKNYGLATICFIVGLIMLPFAFGVYSGVHEWKKTDDFKHMIAKSVSITDSYLSDENGNEVVEMRMRDPITGKYKSLSDDTKIYLNSNNGLALQKPTYKKHILFYLNDGRIIKADSVEQAALGKGETLGSGESRALLEKNVRSVIDDKIKEGKSKWEDEGVPYNYRAEPYTSAYSDYAICEEFVSCHLKPDRRTLIVVVKRNWKKYELLTRINSTSGFYSCLEKGLGEGSLYSLLEGGNRSSESTKIKVDIQDQSNKRLAHIEWSLGHEHGSRGTVNSMGCPIVTINGQRYFGGEFQQIGPELVEGN